MALNQVNIIVRASNGTEDLVLSCSMHWSITKLKELIQNTHLSKPVSVSPVN